ncbi:MAG: hypothetical protein D3908_04190 [Candidatus Electrothrix sp. AUS4]|nr:hypothetical protein [Candidatus Electrothrix sp. AUS4]
MIDFLRFLVPIFAPLPIGVFCLLLALFFLILRMPKMTGLMLLLCMSLFLVLGYGLPARKQLSNMERKYSPLDVGKISQKEKQQIRFVLVLGNANITDPGIPESNQLSSTSLYRLVEGIRIQRELPQTFLILSGGASQDSQANAVVAGKVAESLGMNEQQLIIKKSPKDTTEEAKVLQPMLKDMPFILVTSAAHMERAMKLFQDAGTHPVPAPTDFLVKDNNQLTSSSLVPTLENIWLSERLIYAWGAKAWDTISSLIK